MPTIYNGKQSPLEVAAIAQRNILIPKNTYNAQEPQSTQYFLNRLYDALYGWILVLVYRHGVSAVLHENARMPLHTLHLVNRPPHEYGIHAFPPVTL